jgi:hypothetical protein
MMHTNHIDYRELLTLYRVTDADLRRIEAFGVQAVKRMDELVERWYAWLEGLWPESRNSRTVTGISS